MGIKNYRELSDLDKQDIVDYYKFKNKNFNEISKMLEVSERSVSRVLKEDGIKTRRKNRYTLNEYYFHNINSQEKAYILGFIYADGYVGNDNFNNIVISVNDKEILDKICNEFEFTGEIRRTTKGGFENLKQGFSLNFSSEIMARRLREIGLYPNKSLTITQLPKIKNELMRHFVRGYFDGDGTVILSSHTSYHKVGGITKKYEYPSFSFGILGTEKFLRQIAKYMQIKHYKIRDTKTLEIKNLTCSAKTESRFIYDYLYKDSTIYLERKYNKWNYILSAFTK